MSLEERYITNNVLKNSASSLSPFAKSASSKYISYRILDLSGETDQSPLSGLRRKGNDTVRFFPSGNDSGFDLRK